MDAIIKGFEIRSLLRFDVLVNRQSSIEQVGLDLSAIDARQREVAVGIEALIRLAEAKNRNGAGKEKQKYDASKSIRELLL
ncbi:hypothetical protein GCM10026988_40080 [Vibrio panuliri]